jgi:hypothetical protein
MDTSIDDAVEYSMSSADESSREHQVGITNAQEQNNEHNSSRTERDGHLSPGRRS